MHVLTYCAPGISPECTGHTPTDKYRECLVSALYGSHMDATTGTVDGFNRWVGLVIQAEAETVDDGDTPVTIPGGTFGVLTEDDRGFITWDTYDTAEAAQGAFDDWELRYGLWCEAEEMREAEIMTTSGRIGR